MDDLILLKVGKNKKQLLLGEQQTRNEGVRHDCVIVGYYEKE